MVILNMHALRRLSELISPEGVNNLCHLTQMTEIEF